MARTLMFNCERKSLHKGPSKGLLDSANLLKGFIMVSTALHGFEESLLGPVKYWTLPVLSQMSAVKVS